MPCWLPAWAIAVKCLKLATPTWLQRVIPVHGRRTVEFGGETVAKMGASRRALTPVFVVEMAQLRRFEQVLYGLPAARPWLLKEPLCQSILAVDPLRRIPDWPGALCILGFGN
ncbi:hypothetical protein BGZ61DRAFT_128088 [Ilyonectria robusta]|uniref:uncharacterized protein n=1 Tax=Ilyonectria robusta TaxID=1079257 RepID=UPI001E8ECA4C|nr:uncharacterized protein BGZ61DRAFT_128088 [Ilyonectria robusta]KAH8734694.1 hypothetical protein BGZ61DRAFT_128088 [Ilyonectria robusta]